MRIDEGFFSAPDGTQLYRRSWHPDAAPRACLVVIHGLGEHSGRYEELAAFFVERGFVVEAFDLRGNGRSPGPRGFVRRWDDFRDDLSLFVDRVKTLYPACPVVMLGHSLGGAVVLDYVLNTATALAAVVCSAPAIGTVCVSPFQWALARVLNRIWPTFTVKILSESDLTQDPDVAASEVEDPFTHSRGAVRLAMELRRMREGLFARIKEWKCPLLILHSPDDRVASIDGSRRFAAEAAGVTLQEYPGGAHELFNDVVRETALARTAVWIEKHLG